MEKIRAASALPRASPAAGQPYANSSDVTSAVVAGSSDARRITAYNFSTFEKREKRLPPDACTDKAPRAKLFQFPDRVVFYCAKCRMDGISADSLAFDAAQNLMICVRCFERIVRPKKYRPSRVVPFPSLLSWLNHVPASVMKDVSSDVLDRPAEAAAPSGRRVATEMLGGGSTDIKALPATPALLTTVGGSAGSSGAPSALQKALAADGADTHPCLRLWGGCVHGETCLFRNAPRDLCLAYLMGLHPAADPDCQLVHQNVFGLPRPETAPRLRRPGDLETPNSDIGKWIELKKRSSAKAEWQLFHNGPLMQLLEQFIPMEAPMVVDNAQSEPKLQLNFADISSALKFLGGQ